MLLAARDGSGLLAPEVDRAKVITHFIFLIAANFGVVEAELAGVVLAEAFHVSVGKKDAPEHRPNHVRSKSGAINQAINCVLVPRATNTSIESNQSSCVRTKSGAINRTINPTHERSLTLSDVAPDYHITILSSRRLAPPQNTQNSVRCKRAPSVFSSLHFLLPTPRQLYKKNLNRAIPLNKQKSRQSNY